MEESEWNWKESPENPAGCRKTRASKRGCNTTWRQVSNLPNNRPVGNRPPHSVRTYKSSFSATAKAVFSAYAIPIKPYADPTEQEGGKEHSADPAEQEQQPARCEIVMDLLQGGACPPAVSQHQHGRENG